jgi:hypothetical protein
MGEWGSSGVNVFNAGVYLARENALARALGRLGKPMTSSGFMR